MLTRGQLRARYTSIHPGFYVPKQAERTLLVNALAAWLWTGRQGVIARGAPPRLCTERSG